MKKERINVFFATDANYINYLAVTLKSIMDNAKDERYSYNFYVIHKGLKESDKKVLKFVNSKRFRLRFYNILGQLALIEKNVTIRDYYSLATFYRMIIPNAFFWINKALYLDCDIVVTGDISKLYNTELGDNLLAAVPEQSVQIIPEFYNWVESSFQIKKEEYFNAGVLVMNLKEMRKFHLFRRVVKLSKKAVFPIAQDQDMLNIICYKRVVYLPSIWNTIPMGEKKKETCLIHYIHHLKPWKRPDVMYAELFWSIAGKLGLDKVFEEKLKEITPEMYEAENMMLENLKKFAVRESNHPERYSPNADLIKIDFNDPYFNIPLENGELYNRIVKYEKEGKFDVDINDDPPYKTLEKGMVDYKKKKLKTKLLCWFYNRVSYRYFVGQAKKGQVVIGETKGLENFKNLKQAAIITQNHFAPFDSIPIHVITRKYHPKKWLFKVIREGNYSFPGKLGKFMKYSNPLPLAVNYSVMKEMMDGLSYWLGKGYNVLVYAEQAMWYNYRKPRPTKSGAFQMAAKNNCPILPTFITMEDTDKLDNNGINVQKYTLNIAKPIYPKPELNTKENAVYLQKENDRIWKEIYETTYGIPLKYGDDENVSKAEGQE